MKNTPHYVAINAERIDYPAAETLLQHIHHDWIIHDVYRTDKKPDVHEQEHLIQTTGNIPAFALFVVANTKAREQIAYGEKLVLLGAYETEDLAQANACAVLNHFADKDFVHNKIQRDTVELLHDTGLTQKHILPRNIQSIQSVHIQEINTLHCDRVNDLTFDSPLLCA